MGTSFTGQKPVCRELLNGEDSEKGVRAVEEESEKRGLQNEWPGL